MEIGIRRHISPNQNTHPPQHSLKTTNNVRKLTQLWPVSDHPRPQKITPCDICRLITVSRHNREVDLQHRYQDFASHITATLIKRSKQNIVFISIWEACRRHPLENQSRSLRQKGGMLNIKTPICIYSFHSIYSTKYILHFYTQLKVKSGVNVEGWRGVARGMGCRHLANDESCHRTALTPIPAPLHSSTQRGKKSCSIIT